MLGRAGIPALLLASALIAAATPAFSAGNEDYEGWYVTLDAAFTQPTSLDQHYANHITFPGGGIASQSERLVLDNGADFTGALKLGYGFGSGMGSLQVAFWAFDHDDEFGSTMSGYVDPTLFGYGSYGGMYLLDPTFTTRAKTKATTLDLDYLRSYAAGNKMVVTWLAGLRSAVFQEIQDFEGVDSSAAGFTQHKEMKSTGVGLRLGAGARFGITERFGLEGSAAFSFLQADTKGDSSQVFLAGPTTETNHGEDGNIRGEIRDFDLKGVWNCGKVDWFVGYSMSSWDGMPADPVPANEGGHQAIGSTSTRSRDSIAFNNLHAGVTIRFGALK
jgi:major outer membrane protein